MENKHQRVIPLDDDLLVKMVAQKGELVEKGRGIARQMEDLAKQHEKLNQTSNELINTVNNKKLDILKRVQKLSRGLIGEFEIPVTTELRDGKVVLIVTEALEEFKESFKGFDKWKQALPKSKKKEPVSANG